MPLQTYYTGRTALVTGASSGIGAAIARRLGDAGARVLLVARRADALDAVAREVRQRGGEAVPFAADLEPAGAAEDLVGRLRASGETVDVLVNNAGFGVHAEFLDTDPEAAAGMVTLNALALTVLTRRLLPGMADRGAGGVLSVSSISSFAPAPTFAVYAATKAYVLSFSEAVRAEVRGSGVHVTCLCPGPVRTAFAERAGMDDGFFEGSLSAEAVAEAGLRGLARNRRRVVPGWVNKVKTAATRFVPRGTTIWAAEAMMRRAS